MNATNELEPCLNELSGLDAADRTKKHHAFMLFEPLEWFEQRAHAGLNGDGTMEAFTLEAEAAFSRPWSLLLRHDNDIGAYIRWLIALKVLLRFSHPGEPWLEIVRRYKHQKSARILGMPERIPARQMIIHLVSPATKTDEFELEKAKDLFECFFYRNTNAYQPESRYTGGEFLTLILQAVANRCGRRITPLTLEAFLSAHNGGDWSFAQDNPLQRFESWLLNGLHPPKVNSLSGLMCEFLLPSQKRTEQLQRVVEKLLSIESKPIVNIHARSCWSGLRAFATSTAVALRDAQLSQGRYVGLLYVRLSRAGLLEEPQSLRGVVNYLNEAFGIPLVRGRESQPVHLQHDLLAIRKALTIHQTVIIFDALDNVVGPMSALLDLIRNSFFTDFLRVLCQPEFDTQRSRGTESRSRFLVLSGEPLQEFSAWCDSESLAEPPNNAAARLYTPRPEDEDHLATMTLSLNARRSSVGLSNLYPLKKLSILPMLVEACDRKFLPSETDLAIASLLSSAAVKAVYASDVHRGIGGATRFRQALFSAWFCRTAFKDPLGLIAIQFIGLSMNGLRFDTLSRCLLTWFDRVSHYGSATQVQQLNDELHEFLALAQPVSPPTKGAAGLAKRYSQILLEGRDEEVEALGQRQSEYELELHPCRALDSRQRYRLFDLRSHEIRDLLYAELLSAENISNNDRASAWFLTQSWQLIQSILTDEALQQGTVQVRNLPLSNLASVSSLRRFVQGIVHGLLSFSDSAIEDTGRFLPTQLGAVPISPADGLDKRRYLYLFVYKRLTENAPDWSLSRGYSRSHLRFALAVMFCSKPDQLRGFFASPYSMRQRNGVRWECLTDELCNDRTFVSEALRQYARPEFALRLEMIEALCRSAYDLGMHEFVQKILKPLDNPNLPLSVNSLTALKRLTAHVHPIGGRLSAANGPAFALQKIRMDSYQANLQFDTARKLCEDQLAARGIGVDVYSDLHDLYPDGKSPELGRLNVFHDALRRRADSIVVAPGTDNLVALTDLLGRRAEIAASVADKDPNWINKGDEFLGAYGIFFLADCIRQRIGVTGREWGIVSARILRYWIRLSFKLAKIYSEHEEAPRVQSVAFFIQARFYTDLYSRHLYRLPRERLSMLLVLVSATRILAELDPDLAPSEVIRHLNASLDYLDEAQVLLHELGAPPSACNRFFFERYKTLTRLMSKDLAQRSKWQRLADGDWRVLEDLSKGNNFWADLIDRQRELREYRVLLNLPVHSPGQHEP